MKFERFRFGGAFNIVADNEGINLIYNVAAKMLFPHPSKNKRERKAFVAFLRNDRKNFPDLCSKHMDVFNREFKSKREGTVAGEIMRLRSLCAISSDNEDDIPSLKFLRYLIKEKGFMAYWSEIGYPIKSLRHIWPRYKAVSHLWAADVFICLMYPDKDIRYLDCLLKYPEIFLGYAAWFREIASKYGLIYKKTDLWMPLKWQSIAAEINLTEFFYTEDWLRQKDFFKRTKEEYLEGQHWFNC